MVKKLLLASGVAMCAVLCTTAAAWATTNIYVSPSGSDRGSGSIGSPYKTVARAQQHVRTLTASQSSDIVVNLRAGTHFLDSTLLLQDSRGDSGENGYEVVYQSYGYGTRSQESATISGGRQITGWTSVGGGVYKASVGSLNTRQLYVNGRRALRASSGSGLPGRVRVVTDGYTTDSLAPQSWLNPSDIELVYRGGFGLGTWPWAETRCGIASITGDRRSTTIRMDQPCLGMAQTLYAIPIGAPPAELGAPTNVEHSKSFLTQPGTFYLDRSTASARDLYYIPRAGETMSTATVIAPVLETIIKAEGTSGNEVHDITFRGLTIAHGTWLGPDTSGGFVNALHSLYLDANEDTALTVPANVQLHHAEDLTFQDDRFKHLGGMGLEITQSSSDNVIRGNVFTDISDTGLTVGHDYAVDDVNSGNRIVNNWVHGVGVEYHGAVGIATILSQDTLIAHNQVNDTPYTGIFTGPADDIGQDVTRETRIVHNRVFDVMQTMDDGGAIYLIGTQGTSLATGAKVVGNAVYGQPPGVRGSNFGVYLDGSVNWATVEDNVIYDYLFATGGCDDPAVRNISFIDNFWDQDGPLWVCEGTQENVTETGSTKLTGDPQTACAANVACDAIFDHAGLKPDWQYLLSE